MTAEIGEHRLEVMDPQLQELGPSYVPIVPMSVKAPVAASML
jgi:predicted class III extradiol MEMO1 family dioxygenase